MANAVPAKQCSDGVDNDSDGLIDYGNGPDRDPDCGSPNDNSERSEAAPAAVCADGFDNDGDGKTDYPNDPGCTSASDSSELDPVNEQPAPVCSDGFDNDGDGKTDYPNDPGCVSASDTSEVDPPVSEQPRAACADGFDNDGDGRTDYPNDPACVSASGTSEVDPPVSEQPPPACADGFDNDGDGRTDYPNDPGCSSASDTAEADPATESSDGSPSGGIAGAVFKSEPSLLTPFPIVRLQGRLTRSGVSITRLQVRAPTGSEVLVRCRGRGCPVRRVRRVSDGTYLRIRRFERGLRARTTLTVLVSQPATIGKFTRFRVRKGHAPSRRDACLQPGATVPSRCPSS